MPDNDISCYSSDDEGFEDEDAEDFIPPYDPDVLYTSEQIATGAL